MGQRWDEDARRLAGLPPVEPARLEGAVTPAARRVAVAVWLLSIVVARRLRRLALELWRGDVGFSLGLRYAERRNARRGSSRPASRGRVG